MDLKNLIRPDSVFFIEKTDRMSVLTELAAKSLALGHVKDPDDFCQAVIERESLMSTGIGLGVAIPHAKLPSIDDFFVATAVLKTPVEWDALDRKPVRVVFLIGGPEGSQGAYLRLLAQIMLVIKNDERLRKLQGAATAEDVIGAMT
ncbi:MAG: PTS sugar transporter subunit IIA [Spirochaetales bacterium]|nr:PTS sugar transporter subunit IIA [Spirochaetales bacterium]